MRSKGIFRISFGFAKLASPPFERQLLSPDSLRLRLGLHFHSVLDFSRRPVGCIPLWTNRLSIMGSLSLSLSLPPSLSLSRGRMEGRKEGRKEGSCIAMLSSTRFLCAGHRTAPPAILSYLVSYEPSIDRRKEENSGNRDPPSTKFVLGVRTHLI